LKVRVQCEGKRSARKEGNEEKGVGKGKGGKGSSCGTGGERKKSLNLWEEHKEGPTAEGEKKRQVELEKTCGMAK